MRRAAILSFSVVVVVSLVAATGGKSSPRQETYGASWGVWMKTPLGDVVRIAAASAQTGSAAHAEGVPVALASTTMQRAEAIPPAPDQVTALREWTDGTGSVAMRGGFAEAHVTGDTASSKAGVGTASGSGFAMADRLFSPEQQTQLLNTWADTMEKIFTPLNEALDALAPVFALLALAPHLDAPKPEGFLDVALVNNVVSSVDASSGPGIASVRAETSIADVRLLAGFIEVHDVRSIAVSESIDGAETRTATATIGSLFIGGIEVVADSDGFRVARTDFLARTRLQPALDVLTAALERAGVTLRVAQPRSDGTLREASVLDLEIGTPQGPFGISIAHAEAAAPMVRPAGSIPEAPPAEPPAAVVPPVLPVAPPPLVPPLPPAPGSPPSNLVGPYAGPVTWRPSPAVARALRVSYLLLIIGALLGALVLPMIARRPAVRAPIVRSIRRPIGGRP